MRNLHDTGKAVLLLKTFAPWHGRYRKKGAEGWRTEWRGWSHLGTRDVEDAILGRQVLAFYMATMTRVLPVDIDDHAGHAWNGRSASAELLTRYEKVKERLHVLPSILAQSPRGMHAFFLLDRLLPSEILQMIAEQRLWGVPGVEVKCSVSRPISIPAQKRLLDPQKLLPVGVDYYSVLDAARCYHPQLLFDDEYLPEVIIESLAEKRKRLRFFTHAPTVEDAEGRLIPFVNGETNAPFMELCWVYRCAGLTERDAVQRFREAINRSLQYTGGLRNERELRRRVAWDYSNNSGVTPQRKVRDPSPINKQISCRIADLQRWAPQRRGPIERFVMRLLDWADWHDEIVTNKSTLAVFDYLYSYYRRNRRNGLYPLPSTVLRKFNYRYNEIVPWLCKIGFLEPASFKYSTSLHVCKHYKINRTRFSHS